MRHRGIGAAHFGRHFGVAHGEAIDVQFVSQGLVPWRARWRIVAPTERRINDDALGHRTGAVAVILGEIGIRVADGVAEYDIAPGNGAGDGFRIGVEQQLRRIETMAFLRLIGPVHAIAVKLPRSRFGQISVPDLIGVLSQTDARLLLRRVGRIEQAKLNGSGILGKEREADARAVPGGAERVRLSRPYSHL